MFSPGAGPIPQVQLPRAPASWARARFCAAGCRWLRSVALISVEDDSCSGRALTVVPIMPFERQLLSDESQTFVRFFCHGKGEVPARVDAPRVFIVLGGTDDQKITERGLKECVNQPFSASTVHNQRTSRPQRRSQTSAQQPPPPTASRCLCYSASPAS